MGKDLTSMSRKHYKAIAEALLKTGASVDTIRAIAYVCANDNPRFDYQKFLKACGIKTDSELL